MADLAGFRRNVQIEETKYKTAISESTAQKLGSSVNFINNRQFDTHSFLLNGPYELGVGSVGVDGLYVVPVNMELVGLSFYNRDNGVSGTTTFDIHWLSAPTVDEGTIFTTKPAISSSAGDDAYAVKGLITQISDVTSTGITLPEFSKTTFDSGDALRFDLDGAMNSAQNSGLTIYFRPIN